MAERRSTTHYCSVVYTQAVLYIQTAARQQVSSSGVNNNLPGSKGQTKLARTYLAGLVTRPNMSKEPFFKEKRADSECLEDFEVRSAEKSVSGVI